MIADRFSLKNIYTCPFPPPSRLIHGVGNFENSENFQDQELLQK